MKQILILVAIVSQLSKSFSIPLEIFADEMGEFFEGDMELSSDQIRMLERSTKAGILLEGLKWPRVNGSVFVPYEFRSESLYCKFS